jgi:hypothetical protein
MVWSRGFFTQWATGEHRKRALTPLTGGRLEPRLFLIFSCRQVYDLTFDGQPF